VCEAAVCLQEQSPDYCLEEGTVTQSWDLPLHISLHIGRYLPILHTHPQQVTSTAGYIHYIDVTSTEHYTYTQGSRAFHIQVKPIHCYPLVPNLALASSWVYLGHLLKLKCAHSPLMYAIYLQQVSHLDSVQVTYLEVTRKKRITVYTLIGQE
jgi:hypothetical protein